MKDDMRLPTRPLLLLLVLLFGRLQRGDTFGCSFASSPPSRVSAGLGLGLGFLQPSSACRVILSSPSPTYWYGRRRPALNQGNVAACIACRQRHLPERYQHQTPTESVWASWGMAEHAQLVLLFHHEGSVSYSSRLSRRRGDLALPTRSINWNGAHRRTQAYALFGTGPSSSSGSSGGAASTASPISGRKWFTKWFTKADSSGGSGSSSSDGGSGSSDGGSGGGLWGSNRQGDGAAGGAETLSTSGGNSTALAWTSASFSVENGVEIEEGAARRSPIVRILAPFVGFFRSRAGLYGTMLGYVAFTLSQHITPAYLGISFLALIGPKPARTILTVGAQSLTLLTVASYIQDQFRNQVYPLPAVVAGPLAPYAVITGGSSGIGREIANELAGRGYNLLLVARGKDGLNMAAKELMETSRETVEAARKERETGTTASARREGRRDRKRRLKEEKRERKRKMSTRATENSEPPMKHPDKPSSNSPLESGLVPQNERLKGSPPLPHPTNAIRARWFAADLSNSTDVATVFDEVKRLNITVDILVNSAGICHVGRVDSLEEDELMSQLQLNVAGTTAITQLFAKEFVRRRRGRIMIVSSITAASPIPTVAVYAASKSYLSSFAEALHSELETSGVGVTCVMPGATRTTFEDNSGSADALVWRLPPLCMEADEVAGRAVEALMRGDRTLVPGLVNQLYVHVLEPLVPRKIKMTILEAMWR